jgi:hypothetical protein
MLVEIALNWYLNLEDMDMLTASSLALLTLNPEDNLSKDNDRRFSLTFKCLRADEI